jgi:tetratricopeptide (TPR) repeat protein
MYEKQSDAGARLGRAAWLLATALCLPGYASDRVCVVDEVQAELRNFDYERALSDVESCRLAPEYPRLKGLAFHGLYKTDSASHYLRLAMRRGLDDDLVLISLAETELWRKRFRQAAPLLDKVVDKSSPAYLRVLALRHEQQEDFPEALALYNRALEAEPNSPATRFRKAVLLSWMRRLDESIALFTELIADERTPESFRLRCRVHRAEVMAWNKLRQPAEMELREVIRLDPKNVQAYLKLGLLLEWRSSYKEAKDAYKDALLIEPENREAREKLKSLMWVK